MLNLNKSFGKLSRIENKGRFAKATLSTYSKDKDGNYNNSYWNVKLVGSAFNDLAPCFNEDKFSIEIHKAIIENKSYTDKNGDKKTWLEVVIFEASVSGLPGRKTITPQVGVKRFKPNDDSDFDLF